MEYVIPAVLLLLLIAGFVTFLVLNATKKSGPAADRPDEGPPGIGRDETPLGDTTEHAGEQTEAGTTAREHDRGERVEREDPRPRSERLGNRDV